MNPDVCGDTAGFFRIPFPGYEIPLSSGGDVGEINQVFYIQTVRYPTVHPVVTLLFSLLISGSFLICVFYYRLGQTSLFFLVVAGTFDPR
jgi:hypothetical protein